MGRDWAENDFDWDPHTLEGQAKTRRSATRPRDGDAAEQEPTRVQRRQPFIGCQVGPSDCQLHLVCQPAMLTTVGDGCVT